MDVGRRALGVVAKAVALAVALAAAGAAHGAGEALFILQTSPVAGFQHYAGPSLFPLMRVGDGLVLSREPENPYDPLAVRVLWHGVQIGYAPRQENADLARFMDRGVKVEGRVLHLQPSKDPWKRVLMEILIVEEEVKP